MVPSTSITKINLCNIISARSANVYNSIPKFYKLSFSKLFILSDFKKFML